MHLIKVLEVFLESDTHFNMKIFAKIVLVFGLILVHTTLSAQIKMQKFESIEKAITKESRPIVIFIHTDWCKYCLTMENTTFKNKEIIQTLNDKFYFISFNAESKKPIHFRDYDFKFIPNGRKTGIHELAIQLGTVNGEVSYPTLTILNDKYEIIFQHSSYLSAKQLNKILEKLHNS